MSDERNGNGNTASNSDNNDEQPLSSMTFLRVSNSDPEFDGDDAVQLIDDDLTTSLVPQTPANERERRSLLDNVKNSLRKVGHLLGYITLTAMLIVIPVVIIKAAYKRRIDDAAFHSAEVMVIGTIVLSMRLIYLHLTHWYMPDVQKYVVRILWMVPLYSVQSWLSLRFYAARIYIDTARELYEAYVIASFLYYLIELLGGQDAIVETLRRKTDPHLREHQFPVNLFIQPWDLGMEFMLQCKHGVLQYVVIRAGTTLLTFGLEAIGMYGEGSFQWDKAYPYISFILNISVMYALYCLVKLFHAVNDELCHPINWRPLGKFLCVKGVVFFTWWQGVVIYYLQAHGVIGAVGDWEADEVANGLIDYCICIEMVIFAIAHSYTFTYKEYLPRHTGNNSDAEAQGNEGTYQPPVARTLTRPMRFQDAFWSSTVPEETLHDIQRLRQGVDQAMSRAGDPGEVSLVDNPRQQGQEDEEIVFEDPHSNVVG